jgi:hypothetical protein
MDDGPLASKFSSDGEESFLGRPEARYAAASRGSLRNGASSDSVNKAQEGTASSYGSVPLSRHPIFRWHPVVYTIRQFIRRVSIPLANCVLGFPVRKLANPKGHQPSLAA